MLSHDFPPYDSGGGNQTSLVRDAKELHNSRFEVTVVVADPLSKPFLEDRDFKIFRVHFLDLPPRALWFQIENRKLILKLVSKSDVVLSYGADSSLISRDIVTMGVPLLVRMPGSFISNLRSYIALPIKYQSILQTLYYFGEFPLLKHSEKNDILNSTHLIFDSYCTLRDIERQYRIAIKDKSTVLHNTASKSFAETCPQPEIKNHIVFVGRLYSMKGIMELVHAFAKLCSEEQVQKLEACHYW